MRLIHTSIVSKYIAANDNNKILHTTAPDISSSEETLPNSRAREWVDNNKTISLLKIFFHKKNIYWYMQNRERQWENTVLVVPQSGNMLMNVGLLHAEE